MRCSAEIVNPGALADSQVRDLSSFITGPSQADRPGSAAAGPEQDPGRFWAEQESESPDQSRGNWNRMSQGRLEPQTD